MSYQVLARKWRPRFFDEMVGQEHVLRALINALNEQRLHHAYLFTGTRGVGKTTIARILAKCLNCEQGISARPCGECSACREIAEGRFVDLIEVDAASRTKVEDTRELLDNVQYAPTRGRFKVYLIDEVHMLSAHSFNALLKTLEEPPAHVKFLLATTDPQKLPVTVLSRCLQFSLKNMTPERIVQYLGKVLNAETIPFEEPALWQLGRAAQGSMRDALSLTDQAIAYGEGSVGEEQVNAMLGTMDRGRLFKLAEVMAKADASVVMTEVASMAEHAPDYDEVLQGLLTIWHRAALGQVVPDAIDNAEGDRAAILELSRVMQAEDLQLYYQIGVSGRSDLALAPDPRQGFEMLLLRMLAFRPAPVAPVELDLLPALQKKKLTSATTEFATAAKVEPVVVAASYEVEARVTETPASAVETLAAEVVIEVGAAEPVVEVVSAAVPETAAEYIEEYTDTADSDLGSFAAENSVVFTDDAADEADDEPPFVMDEAPVAKAFAETAPAHRAASLFTSLANAEATVPELKEVAPEPTVAAQPAFAQSTTLAPVAAASNGHDLEPLAPHNWWQWVETLPMAGLTMSIARNSALIEVQGNQYLFDVDPVQGALFNSSQQLKIQDALNTVIGGAKVEMQLMLPRGETPDQRRHRLAAEAHLGAKQAIEGDALVQRIVQEFEATVVDASIRPVS